MIDWMGEKCNAFFNYKKPADEKINAKYLRLLI